MRIRVNFIHHSHEKHAPNNTTWFKRTQFSDGDEEPKIKIISFIGPKKRPFVETELKIYKMLCF